jgi:hypothetical protein
MSVIAYANMLNGREETPPATVETTKDDKMAAKDYVVVLAGLVPAEVLALHAVVLEATTEKSEDGTTIMITDATVLKWSFWGLIALGAFLYIGVHAKNWDLLDFVRMLIPGAAFVGWAMVQPTSAFDAVVGTDFSGAARTVIAAFAAVILGGLGALLTSKANHKPASGA